MEKQALLRELNPLTHGARCVRMVEIGRASRLDAAAAKLLRELENGSAYERRLALQACYGSGDAAPVKRGLNDASRLARGMALKLLPLVGTDEQCVEVLNELSPQGRRVLLRRLAKNRRHAPIDAFLQAAHERGESIEALLPLASHQMAARLWSLLCESAAPQDWLRMARRHPDETIALMRRLVAASDEVDALLLAQANSTIEGAADTAPDAALQLLRDLAERVSINRLSWQLLRLRRPNEIAQLFLQSEDAVNTNYEWTLDARAYLLPIETITALLERVPQAFSTFGLLWRLRPAQRAAVYEVARDGWCKEYGVWPDFMVGLLPLAQRESEARRALKVPALEALPGERLPYAAYLPWEEARQYLEPFLKSSDPTYRTMAHAALAQCVRYHRSHIADYLEFVHARGNEQDPVRREMMVGLSALPPCSWRSDHLEMLEAIVAQALRAADLSQTTASYIEGQLVSMLPNHPQWAAPHLADVIQTHGVVTSWKLESRLTDREMPFVAAALLPIFQAWRTREYDFRLLHALNEFGQHLRSWPEAVELLEQVIHHGISHASSRALEILKEHCRERFAALLPQLLQEDRSWGTLPLVYEYLHRYRQDLLTDYLGRHAHKGRFSTGETRFAPPFRGGFHRWLPEQQELFAQSLNEVLNDKEQPRWPHFYAVTQLAALPDIPPEILISLSRRRGDAQLLLRAKALNALAGLDAGQGIPELIAALTDDRARLAIYALRAVLLEMPAGQAVKILRGVAPEKVTVAKEVVRLLGDIRGAEAFDFLLEWDASNLHRDVRVALLRALWGHLEEPRAWEILQRAAQSPDTAIAIMTTRVAAPRLSPAAQRHLAALLSTLLGHEQIVVRLAVLNRCAAQPVPDSEGVLLRPILAAMNARTILESETATRAALEICRADDAEAFASSIAKLLPQRRMLAAALGQIIAQLRGQKRLLPVARAVLDVLATDTLCAAWRVQLGVAAMPEAELSYFFEELAARGDLRANVLAAACAAIESAKPPCAWESLETSLVSHNDERLRRVALAALLGAAKDTRGWTPERRARLAAFADDTSALVAATAQFTFPPGHGEE